MDNAAFASLVASGKTAGQAGKCYYEKTTSADCPEGWQNNDMYNFCQLDGPPPAGGTCTSPDGKKTYGTVDDDGMQHPAPGRRAARATSLKLPYVVHRALECRDRIGAGRSSSAAR